MNHLIDVYSTKLILSCLKQTLTLGVVTTAVTNTPEEAEEANKALAAKVTAVEEITEITQSLNCCLKDK